MKIGFIVFTGVVILLVFLIFGSIGLSRLVRWLGWPQDILAVIGMLFILLAGLNLIAWRWGVMEGRLKDHLSMVEKKDKP